MFLCLIGTHVRAQQQSPRISSITNKLISKRYNLRHDLLLDSLRKSKPDTNRIALQLDLAQYFLFKPGEYKSDLDSAWQFIDQAMQLSDQLHLVAWHNEVTLIKGCWWYEAQDSPKGLACFMEVLHYH